MGQGYTDYARLIDWDGPLVENGQNIDTSTFPLLGPFDVSKFSCVSLAFQLLNGAARLQIAWFADQARTIQLGVREIVMDPNLGSGWIRLINLGPWVSIQPIGVGGGHPLLNLKVLPTNRVGPLESVPVQSQLIVSGPLPLTAAQQFSVFPNGYYGGPVRILVSTTTVAFFVTLQCLDSGGVLQDVDQISIPANSVATVPSVVPLGAWSLALLNAGGVSGIIDVWVTASPTGSL